MPHARDLVKLPFQKWCGLHGDSSVEKERTTCVLLSFDPTPASVSALASCVERNSDENDRPTASTIINAIAFGETGSREHRTSLTP